MRKSLSSVSWILSAAVSATALVACGNSIERKTNGGANETLDLSKPLEFETVKSAVFSHCTGCHAQYGTYPGVIRQLDEIVDSINKNRMPKFGPPLSAGLKKLLQDWYAARAPEFANKPSNPVVEELKPTERSVYDLIINPRCEACHNPNGRAKFLDLSTRQAIWAVRNKVSDSGAKYIDFDSPADSYIIQVINDPDEPMPPRSSNIRRLTEIEVQVLTEWIGLGMP